MKMWRFVLKENIEHLKLLISVLEDRARKERLQSELAAAEQELGELDLLSAHAHAAHDKSFANVLTTILREQVKLSTANFGLIQLFEVDAACLYMAAQVNFNSDFLSHFKEVRQGDGSACGKALADGDAVWVEDVMQAAFFADHLQVALDAGFRAVKSLPLRRPSGHIVGILSLQYSQPQTWSDTQRARDRHLANDVARSVLSVRPAL